MSFAKTAITALASIALVATPVAASAQVQKFPEGSRLGSDGQMHGMPDSMPRPTTPQPQNKPGSSWICPPTKQDGRLPFLAGCHWGYLTPSEAQVATTQVATAESTGPMCNADRMDPSFVVCPSGMHPAIDDRYVFVQSIATSRGPMDIYHFGELPKEKKGHSTLALIVAGAVGIALGAAIAGGRGYNNGYNYSGPGYSAGNSPSYLDGFGYYQMCRNNQRC